MNTKYKILRDLIFKIQSLKGKSKKLFHHNINDNYDQLIYVTQSNSFQLEEDPSCKVAQGISFMKLEASILLNFLQTKPQLRKFEKKSYDLDYTIILYSSDGRER